MILRFENIVIAIAIRGDELRRDGGDPSTVPACVSIPHRLVRDASRGPRRSGRQGDTTVTAKATINWDYKNVGTGRVALVIQLDIALVRTMANLTLTAV
jgi:hypothetical protein